MDQLYHPHHLTEGDMEEIHYYECVKVGGVWSAAKLQGPVRLTIEWEWEGRNATRATVIGLSEADAAAMAAKMEEQLRRGDAHAEAGPPRTFDSRRPKARGRRSVLKPEIFC